MLRGYLILLAAVATAAGTASAQDYPKLSVLFGASFSNIDRGPIGDSVLPSSLFSGRREKFAGFVFSTAIAVRSYLQIVLSEFGAQYRHAGVKADGRPERSETFQLFFGPEFTKRYARATLFGHGLAGLGHTQRATVVNEHGITEGDMGWLFGAGGGLDLKLARQWSLRVAQLDYMPGYLAREQLAVAPNGSVTYTNVSTGRRSWRFSAGIVLNVE